MRLPVADADLVADQRVARGAVGDAQQRLGEAHQRDALLARQREFLDHALDDAGARFSPQRLDKLRRQHLRLCSRLRRLARPGEQAGQALRFRPAVGGGDRGAQHALRLHRLREFQERLRRRLGRFGHRLFGGRRAGDVLATLDAL